MYLQIMKNELKYFIYIPIVPRSQCDSPKFRLVTKDRYIGLHLALIHCYISHSGTSYNGHS